MEEDILEYLPTVMFRGTPCTMSSQSLALKGIHLDRTYHNTNGVPLNKGK